MSCSLFDIGCRVEESAASLATNAIDRLAIAVTETLGDLMGTLATSWVRIQTPILIDGSGSTVRAAGDHAPGADGIETVLGWVMYGAFGIMVLALIAAGVRMGTAHRDASQHVGRIGTVLVATILISAATGITAAVVPASSVQGSAPVAYLQASLYWYMLAVAIVGVIAGAVKMAWQQRAEAGLDVLRSILTLAAVAGAGLSAVALLTGAADQFAVWILDGAMGCSLDEGGTCFSQAMGNLIVQGATSGPITLPGLLTVILGGLSVLAVIVQIILMIVRSAMLVVLSGMLPISAAATNTAVGSQMFKKTAGWLIGMILYKPAAAVVYATAFMLVGDRSDDPVLSTITGLTLITMALVALPALMSLIVPATSAVASGGGLAGTAAMAAMALPTGAMSAQRRPSGTPAAPTGGTPGPTGPTGVSTHGSGGPAGSGGGTPPSTGASDPGPGSPRPSGPGGNPPPPSGNAPQPGAASPGGPGQHPAPSATGSPPLGAPASTGMPGAGVAHTASGATPVGTAAAAGMTLADGARRGINESMGEEKGPDGAQR